MNYEAVIESILFTMGDSVELSKLAEVLELDKKEVKDIIEQMQKNYEAEDRGITITELDGAYQMCTKPQMYDYLIKVAKQPKHYALTDVLLETLSIIAYKQPITRAEIEKNQRSLLFPCSQPIGRLQSGLRAGAFRCTGAAALIRNNRRVFKNIWSFFH